MTPDRHALLNLMISDMEKAPEIFRPTSFWREGTAEIMADLDSVPIEDFRRMPSALRFFVPTYATPGYHQEPGAFDRVLDALDQVTGTAPKPRMALSRSIEGTADAHSDFRVHLTAAVGTSPHIDQASESNIGNPVEQFSFHERRFSRSFLNYLLGLGFLKAHCDTSKIRRVMEIGGGFGTLGEILLGDARNDCRYIDVDIPPTAYFADYYLGKVLSSGRLLSYDQSRTLKTIELNTILDEYEAMVLCPWQLPAVKGEIDLFVNFISFQEMEPDVVSNYLNHIGRLKAEFVLLRNLLEGKQRRTQGSPVGVETPILGSHYDGFLPEYQLVAAQTEPFGLATVDGFHSQLRLYRRTRG